MCVCVCVCVILFRTIFSYVFRFGRAIVRENQMQGKEYSWKHKHMPSLKCVNNACLKRSK